ncbi:asparagine synthase-related protein [Streptomyces sp. NPDC048637]|uniref:asparagine synthase-related protein n=1 Tax=Streptomyces sp. NPDC048637 TaxID=3155636 RepID=UPI0034492A97
MRSTADIEAAMSGVPGSFHLMASLGDEVYARGSFSEARRLFWASADGATVAADRARTLAWLTGSSIDLEHLALRLAHPDVPHPLASGALWRGVHGVPGAEAVLFDGRGQLRTRRWWDEPPGELPLAVGAPAVRQALVNAVGVRARPGQVLGADLSGGMDSTSLCFLAARAGASLVTATLEWAATGNEDAAYADRAAAQLPGIQRLVYGPADLPACFTGLAHPHEPGDEPTALLRDRAQQQHIADAMRAAGAELRLTGHGGDHVVEAPDQYLHRLLRRHPLHGLRHAAGQRARHHWDLRSAARTVMDTGSYRTWLTGTADALKRPVAPASAPTGWGAPMALPPWAGALAVEQAADLLRQEARTAEPLAHERGQHAWIHQAQTAGRLAGHLFSSAPGGLRAASPFCDDAVINACLAVSASATKSPWRYKPLLAEAMRGLVPEPILARTSKDHSATEWYAGLALHQADLARWAADSRLVACGLADEPELRRAFLSPRTLDRGAHALEATLAAEAWLCDLESCPTPTYLREHADEPADAR